MNIEGKDGPTLKSVFFCDDCMFLGKSALGQYGKFPYKCKHYKILKDRTTSAGAYELMNGDITLDKITPSFCPYLMKKMRFEKLNEINSSESE